MDKENPPCSSRELILTEVCELIHEHTSVRKDRLSENTILQKLGLDGDDADELMIEYAQKFHVDMDDYDFEEYFDVEGTFGPIYDLYLLLFKREKLKKTDISVAELVDAAMAGKWPRQNSTLSHSITTHGS